MAAAGQASGKGVRPPLTAAGNQRPGQQPAHFKITIDPINKIISDKLHRGKSEASCYDHCGNSQK